MRFSKVSLFFAMIIVFSVLAANVPARSTAICRTIFDPLPSSYGFNQICPYEQESGVLPPPAGCGDGIEDLDGIDDIPGNADDEQCDDGCLLGDPLSCDPLDDGDGCSSTCQFEEDGYLIADDELYAFNLFQPPVKNLYKIGSVIFLSSYNVQHENQVISFQGSPIIGGAALSGDGTLYGITTNEEVITINIETTNATVYSQLVSSDVHLDTGLDFGTFDMVYWIEDDPLNPTGSIIKKGLFNPVDVFTVSDFLTLDEKIYGISFSEDHKIYAITGGTQNDLVLINDDGTIQPPINTTPIGTGPIMAMDIGEDTGIYYAYIIDAMGAMYAVNIEDGTGVGTELLSFDLGTAQTTALAMNGMCGDGILDEYNGEACDDDNTQNGDLCSSTCQELFGSCGDGILDPDGADGDVGTGDDEECDDGNNANGDDCDEFCKWEPVTGGGPNDVYAVQISAGDIYEYKSDGTGLDFVVTFNVYEFQETNDSITLTYTFGPVDGQKNTFINLMELTEALGFPNSFQRNFKDDITQPGVYIINASVPVYHDGLPDEELTVFNNQAQVFFTVVTPSEQLNIPETHPAAVAALGILVALFLARNQKKPKNRI